LFNSVGDDDDVEGNTGCCGGDVFWGVVVVVGLFFLGCVFSVFLCSGLNISSDEPRR
jgi:hypothetical protein